MKLIILFCISGIVLSTFSQVSQDDMNPFLEKYNTPYGVPPFELIKTEHYLPALREGIAEQQKEIGDITSNPDEPTFANTIETLERSGRLLTSVKRVLNNLLSANTSDDLQKIAKDAAPLLTKNDDDINLNAALFKRIKAVHNNREEADLKDYQLKLLEDTYKKFTRNGADLDDNGKSELRKINEELALLSLQFADNLLHETNSFKLVIDKKEDLAGLPEAVMLTAADAAESSGLKGKWLFTLHKPSLIPFITYSEKREFREKLFKGYINRGDNDNEFDNKEIIKKVISLRIRKANLLGYKTHADYVLEETMAKTPADVFALLNKLWDAALPVAKQEAADMQQMINNEGGNFKLQPWDWWYYSEKIKKAKFDLDEQELKPYFKLENVIKGVFTLAEKLYGLEFEKLENIPVYHPEVTVYKVNGKDGKHIGLLFTDYFPRASKRGGAWMESLIKQRYNIAPVIINVGNFSKPAGNMPALLSLDEVNTLFHEFGHALHGLLSNCYYETQSGTSVPRDFVELPSQIMENWVTEPEMLRTFAIHYQTGEAIPDQLIEKMQATATFNQGFITTELVAAALLDMEYHTLRSAEGLDVNAFEEKAMSKYGLIPEIVSRYRGPYFQHIFNSGYDAGYYSYIWAAVLDADAFQAFKETDLFNKTVAESFRENILSKGGTEDPMVLYRKFRGKEPSIDPLLKRRGLL